MLKEDLMANITLTVSEMYEYLKVWETVALFLFPMLPPKSVSLTEAVTSK